MKSQNITSQPENMNSATKVAQKYVNHVKAQGIPVTSAYLFGSHAKNTAKNHSDSDICLISKNFGKDYFNETVKLSHLTHDIDDRIEPVAFRPEDLNDRYSALTHEIKTHGILLTR